MHSTEEILNWASETFEIQKNAINYLKKNLNNDFAEVINYILRSKGRLIITGIGKSANIASKIVATLNSTGSPALFMHAADAVHGDLGMVQNHDIIVCISKSGNTPEIKALIPLLKFAGNKIICIVGNTKSFLAQQADFILDTTVDIEACPNNLAPTASTTAQLVMGDALAVCLLKAKGFSSKDFAKYHPGGALGKRLYTRLSDLVVANEKPIVYKNTLVKELIVELTKKRLGAVAVLDNNKVIGIVTDGDIRRMIEQFSDLRKIEAKDIMNPKPIMMQADELAINAAKVMANNEVSQIVVLIKDKYQGMVHIHDLNKEGILI